MSMTSTTTSTTGTELATPAPTLRDLRDAIEAMAPGLRARAADHDRSGELVRDQLDQLRASGFTAALVPTDLGGSGATHAEVGELLRTIARSCPATALTVSMHSHLVAFQVWRQQHGQDASPVLRRVAGERILLVSTGATDWVSSNGSATRVEGGYRVSARKPNSSGCEAATVFVTSVRYEPEAGADGSVGPGGPQVLHGSIPASAPGVSIDRTWDTTGMRGTGSHTVVFDDVFVPDASISLARPADRWHPVWNTVIGCAMPLISAVYLGVADEAVGIALAAAAGTDDPGTEALVGRMLNAHATAADAVTAMLAGSAGLHFANTDEHAAAVLSRKAVAAEALLATGRLAVEIVGGRAFSRSHELERLARDLQGVQFHPLPRAAQERFSGRVALGRSPL